MAHLTAIIDQITRMENSLVNILLETAVKLSTLTDANIFVMVESAGGRKWAGRKSLRDEYVRGLLKPSTKDIEVTETVTSLPQEEFSMGSLMGMASGSSGGGGGGGGSHGIGGGGGSSSRQIDRSVSPEIPPVQTGPLYGSGPAVFPMAHQQPQQTPSSLGREMASDSAQQPSAAKRPRITMSASESTSAPSSGAASSSSASSSSNLPLNSLLPSAASKVLNISNNNVASSPPIHRKKSPIRDQHPQSVSMDGSLSSPKPTSSNNRQETISKNLKDEFNGDDEPSNDSVVIKEELGRMSTPRGMARDDGEDGFEEDPDASLIGGGGDGGVGGGGGGGWGELALAGPSGLQQNPDANQPLYLSELLANDQGDVLADLWRDDDIDHLENRENHRYIARFHGDNGDLIGETPCPFSECDKLFSSAGALRRHIKRIHQNNYAFRCGVCGKGFNEKRDFKLHVDTHSGVKNYKCPHCGRPYSQSGSMHRHARKCQGQLETEGEGGSSTTGDSLLEEENKSKFLTLEASW